MFQEKLCHLWKQIIKKKRCYFSHHQIWAVIYNNQDNIYWLHGYFAMFTDLVENFTASKVCSIQKERYFE